MRHLWSESHPSPTHDGETARTRHRTGRCVAFFDDDSTYRAAMAACLRTEGFRIVEFDSYSIDAEMAITSGEIDAVLLDSEFDASGSTDMLGHLQRVAPTVPIALITERSANSQEENALARGAADYLAKSRGPTIVANRLRLLVNTRTSVDTPPATANMVEFGGLTLRLDSHRALWRGQQVPLTVTEFKIVRLLATAPGTGCSHREIYDVVHGSGFAAGDGPDGYRTNVRSLIRKVRARFRRLDRDFDEIENLAGFGYRWRDHDTSAAALREPDRPDDDARLGVSA